MQFLNIGLFNIGELINKFTLLDVVLTIVVGIGIFIWLWSIGWVTKDISARSDSFLLQIFSIFIVTILTPLIGLPIYLLIRPYELKSEKTGWKDALALNIIDCAKCGTRNLRDFNNCIYCGNNLKIECKECKNKFSYTWSYCERCGAPNIE